MKFNNIREVRKWKFTEEALRLLPNTTTDIYEEEYFTCLSRIDKENTLICLIGDKRRLLDMRWLEPCNKEAKEFFEKYK